MGNPRDIHRKVSTGITYIIKGMCGTTTSPSNPPESVKRSAVHVQTYMLCPNTHAMSQKAKKKGMSNESKARIDR